MKTPTQTRTELNYLVDILIQHEVALIANRIVVQSIGPLKRVTWAPPALAFVPAASGSIEEYCGFLSAHAFTAVLRDGAILQLSYDFRDGDLCGHRLCFYPCPFDVDPRDLLAEPVMDVIDVYRSGTTAEVRLRSPIRFDYSRDDSQEDHPTSHMHILSPDCRCPVAAPLGIGLFMQFVFRHFYRDLWRQHAFLREWPAELGTRTIRADEETQLHISCKRRS